MTKRERFLAIGVAAVVVLLGLQFVIGRVQQGYTLKYQRIDTLNSEIQKKNEAIAMGVSAKEKMNALRVSSLPADRERAISDYNKWLLKLMAESNLREPVVTIGQASPVRGAYTDYRFTAKGKGSIDQITKLLYQFYEKDYLHRIQSMKLTPLNEPNQLDVTMDIQAISIAGADKFQAEPKVPSKQVKKPLDEYLATVVQRNLFAPENRAPRLASTNRERAELGRTVEAQAKAEETDPGQKVRYELVGKVPEGATIDPESGRWKWTPKEKGNFNLLVRATDSGFPAKSVEQNVEIEVTDPPPPPAPRVEEPKFDISSQTYITAILTGRKGPEAWVLSRTDNRSRYIAQGDSLDIGKIKGKVVEIGKDFIVVETEGRRWTAGMDESLAEAFKKSLDD